MTFKQVRVCLWLMLLVWVALMSWRDVNQDWTAPLTIHLYPVNADGSPSTSAYLDTVDIAQFAPISDYYAKAGLSYGQQIRSTFVLMDAPPIAPPSVPATGKVFDAVLFSLKLRYYNHKVRDNARPDLTLFLNYYAPDANPILHQQSTVLERGRVGVVHLFASTAQEKTNQIVIAHEALHGFGALDKYNLATGMPLYPQGFAQPDKQPLYPQTAAELMAIHIPYDNTHYKMPKTLEQTRINPQTAQEIGWL